MNTHKPSGWWVAGPYLGHEGDTLLQGGVQVPDVQADHHLPQEGVATHAPRVPHGDPQGVVLQLLPTDRVLEERGRPRGGGEEEEDEEQRMVDREERRMRRTRSRG